MATHCEKMYRILRVLLVMEGHVAVKRKRPGSHYNGMTQYIPSRYCNKRPTETKVAVWWPNRKVKSPWNATLVPEEEAHPHCTRRQRSAKKLYNVHCVVI